MQSCIRTLFGGKSIKPSIQHLIQLRFVSDGNSLKQTEKIINDADLNEIEHHAKYASEWWDPLGPMRGLHAFNRIRVPFIRDGIVARGSVDSYLINTPTVLKDQKILEVGCGAGILTERLAGIGANVTGIDLGEDVIRVANEHLETHSSHLKSLITYKIEPVSVHAQNNLEKYDAVVVSEVLEHISDKPIFLTSCVDSLKPGGSIFITTLDKSILMWIAGVMLAEYVFKIVPKGTHHWDKLISPIDVQRILDALNCQTVLINGCTYEFWKNSWRWINYAKMNYALQAIKNETN